MVRLKFRSSTLKTGPTSKVWFSDVINCKDTSISQETQLSQSAEDSKLEWIFWKHISASVESKIIRIKTRQYFYQSYDPIELFELAGSISTWDQFNWPLEARYLGVTTPASLFVTYVANVNQRTMAIIAQLYNHWLEQGPIYRIKTKCWPQNTLVSPEQDSTHHTKHFTMGNINERPSPTRIDTFVNSSR